MLYQYGNPANAEAHYLTTAPKFSMIFPRSPMWSPGWAPPAP